MRTFIVVVMALALSVAVGACKKKGAEGAAAGGDPCSVNSKCEKEEPMSAAKIAACQAQLADKDCGPAAKAMVECEQSKQTCTPDGKLDQTAMATACATEMGAYMACAMKASGAPAMPSAPPAPPAANP